MNVLIDDSGKAVLCDFGLSRIKADVNSRTTRSNVDLVVGSRNWMAPERLMGRLPRKPSDIYAFGLMIFEVCAARGSSFQGGTHAQHPFPRYIRTKFRSLTSATLIS
jgi:serine/threonine protein kinase